MSIDEVFELTKIDRWFLQNIAADRCRKRRCLTDEPTFVRRAKKLGFSDRQLAQSREVLRKAKFAPRRKAAGVIPTYRLVDTCAAEFEAYTPYYYSTYGDENETARERQTQDHDPGRRTEPHRAGH